MHFSYALWSYICFLVSCFNILGTDHILPWSTPGSSAYLPDAPSMAGILQAHENYLCADVSDPRAEEGRPSSLPPGGPPLHRLADRSISILIRPLRTDLGAGFRGCWYRSSYLVMTECQDGAGRLMRLRWWEDGWRPVCISFGIVVVL